MFFEFTLHPTKKKVLVNTTHVQAFIETEGVMRILFSNDTNEHRSVVEVSDNYQTFMNQLKYASLQPQQPNMNLR